MKDNKKTIIIILIMIALSLAVFAIKHNQLKEEPQVSVYFVKQISTTKNQVIPVKRRIKFNKIETAINELLKGPTAQEKDAGFFTEIPEKTTLIGIKETPTRIEINLSKDFTSGGGSESMKLRVKQVSDTATDAADGKPVYLDVNNKKAEVIGGEGLELTQPLAKDEKTN